MNAQVEVTLDILRGELERLFTLEEMTSMCERLLGLDPSEVGGATAKRSFARAHGAMLRRGGSTRSST